MPQTDWDHQKRNSLQELQGTCSSSKEVELNSLRSHQQEVSKHSISDISLVMFKNSQVQLLLTFPEATCEFRRRDVVTSALNSGAGKHPSPPPPRLQAVWFLLAVTLLFVHQDSLDEFSTLSIRHDPLNQCRPCIAMS